MTREEILLHARGVPADAGVRVVHPLPQQQHQVRLLLRNPQRGVRPGVVLGRGPRHALGVGAVRDLLRHPRLGGETTKAQRDFSGESVVDPAGDARGKCMECFLG